MTSARAVIFDLGKVLLDFDYGLATGRLAAAGNVAPEAVHRLLFATPLLDRFESGQLTSEEFYRAVRDATGYRLGYADFRRHFAEIFTPVAPMVALHTRLRQRAVPCYILSNTNEIAIAHIREACPFLAGSSGFVYSFEHGCMKPAEHIYRVAESMSGFRGAELFYLDDRAENVATARRLGWQAQVHHDPAESVRAVEATGLL